MRVKQHRGRPKRLGPPPEGVLRRLTVNEMIATGWTSQCLVGVFEGEARVFKPNCGGASRRFILLKDAVAYRELWIYWKELEGD